MADLLDRIAAGQRPALSPTAAAPTTGASPTQNAPATAPVAAAGLPVQPGPVVSRGAGFSTTAPAGGDLLDAIAANPSLATPQQPREPGEFGPYDESESHLFAGPFDKGVYTGLSKGFGLHRADDSPVEALADTWDNLVEGAKSTFRTIRDRGIALHGSGPGSTAMSNAAAAAGTPLVMAGQGIMGLLEAGPHGIAKIADGLQHPEPDAEGVTGRQRIGEGIGTLLSLLGQLAVSEAGGEAGEAARTGEMGKALEKNASGPGNALVRAKKANYSFGKDPGRYLVDEPVKPPVNVTRLGQLENLHAQNVAHGEALHAGVNDLLRSADTVQAILPNGTVARVPNVMDWATEIEDAAEETKRDVQRQAGAPNRAKIAKAVNEMRDDILSDHDVEGQATGPKPREGTPTQVNDIKKSIGGRPNWKLITDPDAAEVAAIKDRFAKKAYGKLNDLVDNAVDGKPGERVRDLNRRFSNAIEFRQLLEDEIAKEKGTGGWNAAARKGSWLGAGTAAGMGHPYVAATVALNQLLRTVPGRIATAKVLGGAGRVLQSPAARVAAGAAVTAAGAIPAVSAGARRTLAGQEGPEP